MGKIQTIPKHLSINWFGTTLTRVRPHQNEKDLSFDLGEGWKSLQQGALSRRSTVVRAVKNSNARNLGRSQEMETLSSREYL